MDGISVAVGVAVAVKIAAVTGFPPDGGTAGVGVTAVETVEEG